MNGSLKQKHRQSVKLFSSQLPFRIWYKKESYKTFTSSVWQNRSINANWTFLPERQYNIGWLPFYWLICGEIFGSGGFMTAWRTIYRPDLVLSDIVELGFNTKDLKSQAATFFQNRVDDARLPVVKEQMERLAYEAVGVWKALQKLKLRWDAEVPKGRGVSGNMWASNVAPSSPYRAAKAVR